MRYIFIVIAACFSIASLNGCSTSNGQKEEAGTDTATTTDTLNSAKAKIKTITEAVRDNDPHKFASAVSYPLQRPYPLHDINNSREMEKYYPTLVGDQLKKTVTQADSTDWTDMGWRGHALADGQMWVDEDGLYAMDYISPAEASMRDSLRRAEIASLPAQLQGPWTPVGTFYDTANGKIYRIDVLNDGETYRLAVFDAANLKQQPLKVLTGSKNVEGSAESVSYNFSDGVTVVPEDSQTGQPTLQQNDTDIPLKPVYWLDLNQPSAPAPQGQNGQGT